MKEPNFLIFGIFTIILFIGFLFLLGLIIYVSSVVLSKLLTYEKNIKIGDKTANVSYGIAILGTILWVLFIIFIINYLMDFILDDSICILKDISTF